MYDIIKNNIEESVQLVQAVNNDPELIKNIELACSIIIKQFDKNKKLLICGNGGSAADAQHIASEFTGKYYLDRAPMNAEALHTDTSYLTAVSNDYGFEHIYSRMVEAKANKEDVLIAMSTSGNSKNIIMAIKKANQMGLHTIGLGSELKGEMATLCQTFICVPSKNTARIQEMHLFIGHTICQIVEAHFHNNKK
jgi:D-sedoheptulose 7-phosphate isomerase